MAGYTYNGPADTLQLETGGKVFRPGQDVPISKEQALRLAAAGGHQFEGLDPNEVAAEAALLVSAARARLAMPADDRGQVFVPKGEDPDEPAPPTDRTPLVTTPTSPTPATSEDKPKK